jgi:putative glycosyltransferase
MHISSPVSERPLLSIVTTMYRSRRFLDQFIELCLQTLHENACTNFEILFVNDGSPDDSVNFVLEKKRQIPEIVLIDLSRNFGHHYAMHAGLRHARGDLVLLIDCDLEVSPLILGEFRKKMEEVGCDMVYGFQEVRKGGMFERASGGFFYKTFNLLSDIKIPENIATERLMTRRYVDALLGLGDRNLFMGGMMSWIGFEQVGIPVRKKQREGKSSYTLLRRIHLMVNAVSSFSALPLVWMFNVGMLITSASFVYLFYLLVRKVFFNDAMIGFTSMMAVMTLSLGILTTGLGILGIYLGKVFTQVQNRPTYIVKDIHR